MCGRRREAVAGGGGRLSVGEGRSALGVVACHGFSGCAPSQKGPGAHRHLSRPSRGSGGALGGRSNRLPPDRHSIDLFLRSSAERSSEQRRIERAAGAPHRPGSARPGPPSVVLGRSAPSARRGGPTPRSAVVLREQAPCATLLEGLSLPPRAWRPNTIALPMTASLKGFEPISICRAATTPGCAGSAAPISACSSPSSSPR